ncbi:MAG: stage II sporulation protein R [Clostridia bacterium]|nr:stage II sporulation protein R [Clostridia bacterium]
MKKICYMMIPALVLAASMVYLLLAGEQDAAAVRQGVVRFHVVAASDSAEDQQLKLRVRDGLFAMIKELFADCTDQAAALKTAEENREELESAAREILQQNGCDTPITLEIGQRYFPTKDYGSLSFPAGSYQAVSIRIGEARGQNFWCVLYPALCIAPAVAEDTAADEMTAVIGEESTHFLQKSTEKEKIKFALVEWFEHFMQKYLKS